MEQRQIKDYYKLEKKLGEGSFGLVRRAKNKANEELVAIKIIKKSAMNEQDKLALQNEIQILKNMDHPNIVKLLDVFEDVENFYLVMELMKGGELFDVVIEKEHFDEEEARNTITPIIDAIKYCHDQSFIHRDIKPENLLFTHKNFSQGSIKVSDFGLARSVNTDKLATTTCGTPGYVAPEILMQKPYGKECDYWSIGVVLYILLSGVPPFYEEDNFQLFEKIKAVDYDFSDPTWKNVSKEAQALIKKLLVKDPKKRMTCDQLLQDPWIRGTTAKVTTKNNANLQKMRDWNSKRKMV